MSAITVDLGGPALTTRRCATAARPAGAERPRETGTSPGLRLTRRGRVVVFWTTLAAGLAGMLGTQGAFAGVGGEAVPVVTHTVVAGETLWDIASGIAAPGEDVRDVVAELADLNGLAGVGLQAGQRILLPAER